MSVVFGSRMKRSYKVELKGDIKYKNDRAPHVETPIEQLTGKEYKLGVRRVKKLRDQISVMYDIEELPGAHITVYFGPEQESKEY
jgi:hypothetical protein